MTFVVVHSTVNVFPWIYGCVDWHYKYTSMLLWRFSNDWLISSVSTKVFLLKVLPYMVLYHLRKGMINCLCMVSLRIASIILLRSVKHLNDVTLYSVYVQHSLHGNLLQQLGFAWCSGTWCSPHAYGSCCVFHIN